MREVDLRDGSVRDVFGIQHGQPAGVSPAKLNGYASLTSPLPFQVLLEKADRAPPGEPGRSLVVAGRGVVVETMLRARVVVNLVRYVVRLESRLVRSASG